MIFRDCVITLVILFYVGPLAFSNAEIQKNPVNSTNEIKELFNGDKNVSKQIERSSVADLSMNGNHFAEGSSHNEDKQPEISSNHLEKSQADGREHGPVSTSKNISQINSDKNVNSSNDGAKIDITPIKKLNDDSSLSKKLIDDTDLTWGSPQIDHINGSSSIKPRKGVPQIDPAIDDASAKQNPSKIVPRKGVPPDNSLPVNNNCFKTNNNTCFNVTKFQDLDCSCCNNSNNNSQAVISPENSVNCSYCKPIDDVLVDSSLSCTKVCCKNKTLDSNKLINNSGLVIVSNKNETVINKKKHKPTITREPVDNNDAENVTTSTFQSKKAVVIPIIVSVLFLPLISILSFFVYKKTKDYWDKRYYKRMDFLIDGMYND